MARPKLLSDADVLAQVLGAVETAGEKSVSFGLISAKTGLAPATLAQRYGSIEGMLRHALLAEWARLAQSITETEGNMAPAKGVQALLKALPTPSPMVLALSMRDPTLREAAEAWRILIEGALAARRGGGGKAREAAALIFAAWQGRQIWSDAGGKGFRLADLIKILT